MLIEIIKFMLYSVLIVIISKYILVEALRKLAEALNLKAKIVGNIAGYATSMPELLTITTSSIRGLSGVSIYNILSSNIINLIQYLFAVILNKNTRKLKNIAIKTDIVMVILTILIPAMFLNLDVKLDISIVPLFIILYIGCKLLNNNAHRIYLDSQENHSIQAEYKKKLKNKKSMVKNILIIVVTGVLLFIISELLGNTLEHLCYLFNISEIIVGALLGFITSIPELVTFFESQRLHKKAESDMLGVVEATNNLLTSNTVNLFIIQTIGILMTKV